MTILVRIDIACNDPDNGNFAGRAFKVSVGDDFLSLDARNYDYLNDRTAPRLRDEGDCIVLSGKRWPYERSKDWIGNWCWNGFWMKEQVARQFLVWLHRRKLFTVDCCDTELYDAWQSDDPLPLEPDRPIARGLGALLIKLAVRA